MSRRSLTALCFVPGLALCFAANAPAAADDIDSLKGQFGFDWHTEPSRATCIAIDDKMIATFKSDAYTCDLNVITNTASGEEARVCGEKSEGAEYLIFATKKACDSEREVQASNSEEE